MEELLRQVIVIVVVLILRSMLPSRENEKSHVEKQETREVATDHEAKELPR